MKDRVWSTEKFTLHIQPALAPYHYAHLKQFWETQPQGQPTQRSQWQPTGEGNALVYHGQGNFDGYIASLQYLIDHFLQPWGYVVEGATSWKREDGAAGFIAVKANQVQVFRQK